MGQAADTNKMEQMQVPQNCRLLGRLVVGRFTSQAVHAAACTAPIGQHSVELLRALDMAYRHTLVGHSAAGVLHGRCSATHTTSPSAASLGWFNCVMITSGGAGCMNGARRSPSTVAYATKP